MIFPCGSAIQISRNEPELAFASTRISAQRASKSSVARPKRCASSSSRRRVARRDKSRAQALLIHEHLQHRGAIRTGDQQSLPDLFSNRPTTQFIANSREDQDSSGDGHEDEQRLSDEKRRAVLPHGKQRGERSGGIRGRARGRSVGRKVSRLGERGWSLTIDVVFRCHARMSEASSPNLRRPATNVLSCPSGEIDKGAVVNPPSVRSSNRCGRPPPPAHRRPSRRPAGSADRGSTCGKSRGSAAGRNTTATGRLPPTVAYGS